MQLSHLDSCMRFIGTSSSYALCGVSLRFVGNRVVVPCLTSSISSLGTRVFIRVIERRKGHTRVYVHILWLSINGIPYANKVEVEQIFIYFVTNDYRRRHGRPYEFVPGTSKCRTEYITPMTSTSSVCSDSCPDPNLWVCHPSK
jgi:hypothetical protein